MQTRHQCDNGTRYHPHLQDSFGVLCKEPTGGFSRTPFLRILTPCAYGVRRECLGEAACLVVPAACGTVVSAPLALVLCRSCARDRTARKRELACVDECGASAGRRSARMSVCRRMMSATLLIIKYIWGEGNDRYNPRGYLKRWRRSRPT